MLIYRFVIEGVLDGGVGWRCRVRINVANVDEESARRQAIELANDNCIRPKRVRLESTEAIT